MIPGIEPKSMSKNKEIEKIFSPKIEEGEDPLEFLLEVYPHLFEID
jgi:hypothetical protein